jgi:hypothetical protein
MSENKFEDSVILEDGTTVKVYVKKPDNDSVKAADRYRAKAWNDAFKDGVLTKKEVHKIMKDRNLWNDEKTSLEEGLTEEILKLEKKLYRGDGKRKPKLSEGREVAIKMKEKRNQLRDLIAERISMDENTTEALADNARFDYLVSCCAFYSDTDEPVFPSYEDYNKRSSDTVANTVATLLAKMMYDLDEDFENNLPENQFLQQFGLINNKGDLIDPNNEEALVDSGGRRINSEGYYIDEDGNRVDKSGVPINENGLYELVEYDNDLVIEKPKPVKKTSAPRRKTAKAKTKETVEQ